MANLSDFRGQSFTSGAFRALALSAHLSETAGLHAVNPAHLLWALWLDEAQAAEFLAEIGFSTDQLTSDLPLEMAVDLRTVLDQFAQGSRSEEYPLSDAVAQIVTEAKHQVRQQGRHAELGSEHLLYGLMVVESEVASLLSKHGLSAESLATQVEESTGLITEPLPADFDLTVDEPIAVDQNNVWRILDAAANRCREGLRVVEDFARFSLDDAHLTRLFKEVRHAFTDELGRINLADAISARETETDVGTQITTPQESVRTSALDVVSAGCKRVEESLRTLEEYSKIVSPESAAVFEQLRYRFYTLEKALLITQQNIGRLAQTQLYLLVTSENCQHGLETTVRDALAGGVDVVQLREKSLSDSEIVAQGLKVRAWTREAGALFIMNDRADLALLTNADGVHVGQDEISVKQARRILGPQKLVGVSTHTIEQARQAVLDGADYIGVGPVFQSGTKHFEKSELAGLKFVEQVAAEISLPWFAIGGISDSSIDQVTSAGASRVAVSGAICAADDVQNAARKLRNRLQ